MQSNLANWISEAWKNNYTQLLRRSGDVIKQEKARKQVNALLWAVCSFTSARNYLSCSFLHAHYIPVLEIMGCVKRLIYFSPIKFTTWNLVGNSKIYLYFVLCLGCWQEQFPVFRFSPRRKWCSASRDNFTTGRRCLTLTCPTWPSRTPGTSPSIFFTG